MFEAFVTFVSEFELVSTYLKLAVFLYAACYIIEEVLGKYRRPRL